MIKLFVSDHCPECEKLKRWIPEGGVEIIKIIRDDVERPFLDVQMSETRLRNLRDAITKALRKIKKMEAKNQ